MIIVVADDAGMHSSQNEQDSRHYAKASKIPMLEPSDSAEALSFTKLAYELSEEFDTPVIIMMCTRVAHSQSLVETSERVEPPMKPYEKNIGKYVMMPGNAIRRHPGGGGSHPEAGRLRRDQPPEPPGGGERPRPGHHHLQHLLPVCEGGLWGPLSRAQAGHGVASAQAEDSGLRRLGGQGGVEEELDPFLEDYCRETGLDVLGKDVLPMEGEFSQTWWPPAGRHGTYGENSGGRHPRPSPVMCAGCPHRGLFYTLNKNKCTVMGDIGCYTLGAVAPLAAMDMTLCMGGSISGLHGFNKARGAESEHKTVAVIGDSTFMHSGMTGLANIAYNQSNSTVIILDNSSRHDRPPAEPHHPATTSRGPPPARSIWSPCAGPWASSGCGW